MYLLEISIETRIIIGIAAMVLLFTGFLIEFVTGQRKKLQYQKSLQAVLEQKQQILAQQNQVLEEKVNERTAELEEQKKALQVSLAELKATQQQLVQSEKMASLGEMTAGIAHEIQNPLNFITNFSDVSVELFEEMQEAMQHKKQEEAAQLALELKENLQRIHLHSLRADKIVKGMLGHSRIAGGKRELTNLNEVVEESLKLSLYEMKRYLLEHPIDARFEGNKHIPPILVVPQEISRVLINICNNALYAVGKRIRESGDDEYQPSVIVSTHLEGREAVIRISDNGSGIPKSILPKIFNPFFTTKPTGEGTGLGLSLSYDIIARAHEGKLDVDSEEGQGTTFTISLPLP